LRYYPLLEARRVAADHGNLGSLFLVPVRIAELTQASVDPNYNTAVLPSPSQLEFDATGSRLAERCDRKRAGPGGDLYDAKLIQGDVNVGHRLTSAGFAAATAIIAKLLAQRAA